MIAPIMSEPALTLLPKRKRPAPVIEQKWEKPDGREVELLRREIVKLTIETALCWEGWQLGHRAPWKYKSERLNETNFPRRLYDLRQGRYKLVGIEHYQCEHESSVYRVTFGLAYLLAGWGWLAAGCTVQVCPDEWVYAAHRQVRLFKLYPIETKGK